MRADSVKTETYFNFENLTADVDITQLEAAPSPMQRGVVGDIVITLRNKGTISALVYSNVSVSDASHAALVFFSLSPTEVLPGASVQLVKSIGRSFEIGRYYLQANASYDGGETLHHATLFYGPVESGFDAVRRVQIPMPPGYGGGGNVQEVLPEEEAIPPEALVAQIGAVELKRTVVLREMAAGSSAFESIALVNNAGKVENVTILLDGIPRSWVSYEPVSTIILPGEERILNVGLNVPPNAMAGDYLARATIVDSAGSRTVSSFVLRVKSYDADYNLPFALRTVRVEPDANATVVSISIVNHGSRKFSELIVDDDLPDELKGMLNGVSFVDKPGNKGRRASASDLEWSFTDLRANEIAQVSYRVPMVIQDYSKYVYWPGVTLKLIEFKTGLADLLKIASMSVKETEEGDETEVSGVVVYAGLEPLEVYAALTVPNGLELLEPKARKEVLLPASATKFSYRVKAPSGSAGTHVLTFALAHNSTVVSKDVLLIVSKPAVSAVASSLPFLAFLAAAVVAGVLVSIYSSGRRKSEEHRLYAVEKEQQHSFLREVKEGVRTKD